jgi:hypothetical protein
MVDLVVNLVPLEACSEGRWYGPGNAVPLMPVVKDMQECQAGIFRDSWGRGGVYEVPC